MKDLFTYDNILTHWWIIPVVIVLVFLICIGICLAETPTVYETIARESANQLFAAQVSVAEVIKTRAVERHLTPEQVCLQRLQFSCWNPGVKQKPRTPQELATAKKAWETATASGVNLYHDISVRPYWVAKVQFIKQVGELRFYREQR